MRREGGRPFNYVFNHSIYTCVNIRRDKYRWKNEDTTDDRVINLYVCLFL